MMNSGDVHRHPPLAQHAVSAAGGGCGWYTAAAPPALPLAPPTAPARLKRAHQPPPLHAPLTHQPVAVQMAQQPALAGSGPPLSPGPYISSTFQGAFSTHHIPSMSMSVRAPPPPTTPAPHPPHATHTTHPTHTQHPPHTPHATHTPHPTPAMTASLQACHNAALMSVCSDTSVSRPTGAGSTPASTASMAHMPWHHGAISRERAEQLLSSSIDGVFLVRESTNFPGDHTLCVRWRGRVEHYRVKWVIPPPGTGGAAAGPALLEHRLTIDDEEFFDNMADLIDHYLQDADGLCTQLVRCLPKQTLNGGATHTTNNNGPQTFTSAQPPPPGFAPNPSQQNFHNQQQVQNFINSQQNTQAFVNNQQQNPQNFISSQQATQSQFVGNQQAAPSQFVGNQQATPSQFVGNQQATSSQFVGNQQATPSQFVGNQQATQSQFVVNQQATQSQFVGNQPTTQSQFVGSSNQQQQSGGDQLDGTPPSGACLAPQAFVDAGWMISERDLEIRENIGKGEFGDVMLGILNGTQKVAVKILKDREAANKFLAEASLMTSLKHENLVRLLGLVFSTNGSTCIVTEHMSQGSLLDYLRSRGRHYVTQNHQINFAYDACCGMEYLERRRVVHRDLAARNVLIARDGAAKVADFGMARPVPPGLPEDDAAAAAAAKLPIKWTAPEALKLNKFSNKSDMWSFGILLWEIYSFGRVPYPRIPLAEVVKHVERGYRMEAPDGCPTESYELMRHAWHSDPAQRPTFAVAKHRLARIRNPPPAVVPASAPTPANK